jgi:hypothetical protein
MNVSGKNARERERRGQPDLNLWRWNLYENGAVGFIHLEDRVVW